MEDFAVFVDELRRLANKAREMDMGAIMARWRVGRNLNERYGFATGGGMCGEHNPECGHIPSSEKFTIMAALKVKSPGSVDVMRQFHKLRPIEKEALSFARACGNWSQLIRSFSTGNPADGVTKAKANSNATGKYIKELRRVPARNRNIVCRWLEELAASGCEDPRESLTVVMERLDIVALWRGMGQP